MLFIIHLTLAFIILCLFLIITILLNTPTVFSECISPFYFSSYLISTSSSSPQLLLSHSLSLSLFHSPLDHLPAIISPSLYYSHFSSLTSSPAQPIPSQRC